MALRLEATAVPVSPAGARKKEPLPKAKFGKSEENEHGTKQSDGSTGLGSPFETSSDSSEAKDCGSPSHFQLDF
eukprot:g33636.t1